MLKFPSPVLLPALLSALAFTQALAGTGAFVDYTVNLNRSEIGLFLNNESGRPFGDFKPLEAHLAQRGRTLEFAMNGGIFMEDLRPLGLYVENGKTLRRLVTRKSGYGNFYLQPNGVFAIGDREAWIVATDRYAQFAKQHAVRHATQSGPLLISAGRVNDALKRYSRSQLARNAVCIQGKDRVVFSVTRQPVSFLEFALHLKNDLNCQDALYMDGAISDYYLPGQDSLPWDHRFGPLLAVLKRRKAR